MHTHIHIHNTITQEASDELNDDVPVEKHSKCKVTKPLHELDADAPTLTRIQELQHFNQRQQHMLETANKEKARLNEDIEKMRYREYQTADRHFHDRKLADDLKVNKDARRHLALQYLELQKNVDHKFQKFDSKAAHKQLKNAHELADQAVEDSALGKKKRLLREFDKDAPSLILSYNKKTRQVRVCVCV